MLDLIFMGTPAFAVPTLEALLARGHRIRLVVTQPDKPKGRGQKLSMSPVKEKALELGLLLAQPESLKDPEFHDQVEALKADLMVVVAFKILPASLFPLARLGAVNIHGSLLPKFRGAAPIQWAIARGETETGVTIFQLDSDVDHGTILAQAKTPIGPEENAGELFGRLSVLGRDLLLQTVEDMEKGVAKPMPQDHALATSAPKLRKENGLIDWSLPAREIHNRIRAFNPYPVCYTPEPITGRTLRIWSAAIAGEESSGPGVLSADVQHQPVVGTGSGSLRLIEVQWEGKPRLSGPDFLNGLRGIHGVRFG